MEKKKKNARGRSFGIAIGFVTVIQMFDKLLQHSQCQQKTKTNALTYHVLIK